MGDRIDVVEGFRADLHATLVAFLVVAAVWGVALSWIKTRALAPVMAALLVGVVVVWSVANYRYLASRIDGDSARLQEDHEPVPVGVPIRGEG